MHRMVVLNFAVTILNISPLRWEDLSTLLEHHTVSPFEKLADRIDLAQAEQILG